MQTQVVLLDALEAEGLLGLVEHRETGDLPTGDEIPILLAVSDDGPLMTAEDARSFMGLCSIAQHFGRPGAPTDQAPVESFDGFLGTDLDEVLAERGVRGLLVAGLVISTCVPFTASTATQRGYLVRVVSDCCSDHEEMHHATLAAYPSVFDPVRSDQIAERRDDWDAELERMDTWRHDDRAGESVDRRAIRYGWTLGDTMTALASPSTGEPSDSSSGVGDAASIR